MPATITKERVISCLTGSATVVSLRRFCVVRGAHTTRNGIEHPVGSLAKSLPDRRVLSNAAITLLPQTSSRLDAMRTWYEPGTHGKVDTKLHRVSHSSISTWPSIGCPHVEAMVIECGSNAQSNGLGNVNTKGWQLSVTGGTIFHRSTATGSRTGSVT
jgi:hypothetical protein